MTSALPLLVFTAIAVAIVVITALGALATAAVVAGFVVRRRKAAPEAGEPLDDDALPRLLVLRAFLVGRFAGGRRENEIRSVAVIRLEDRALREVSAPRDVVLRGMFYALALAELDRRMSQNSRRRPAKKLGERLGKDDPYPLYLRMVEATTRHAEPGAAPPKPWDPSGAVISDEGLAAAMVGLTAEQVERHRRFLFELPIQRWR